MTGRASPNYGRIAAAIQGLAEAGHGPAAIRAALVPLHGYKAVYRALNRAYDANVLPRPPKKRPGVFVILLPGEAGRRIERRAAREGLRPSALARIILHRASRMVDTMELHL